LLGGVFALLLVLHRAQCGEPGDLHVDLGVAITFLCARIVLAALRCGDLGVDLFSTHDHDTPPRYQ
jgi:hypothetical protein